VSPTVLSSDAVLDHFKPGSTIYIPGGVAELSFLRDLLIAEPERLDGVTLVSGFIPGINGFDYAGLHPAARMRVFMMSDALQASFAAGRVEVLPLAYTGTAAYLASLQPDLAILHLTTPRDGLCSFGVAADFGPIVAGSAKALIGVLNAAMPCPARSPTISLTRLDALVKIEAALPVFTDPTPTPDTQALAGIVADLVPDGAVVQTGIGAAPAAVWRALHGHKRLRLRSGLVTDGVLAAWNAGAMAEGGHLAGIAYGSKALHAWLDDQDRITFADVFTTHMPDLSDSAPFMAINSALEIDLFGQVNLEWRAGRWVSGVGGAPDFTRIARASPGGRSIVALPSTAASGSISRIVGRLTTPTVSLPRTEVDTVATEYGFADLKAVTPHARAEALIAIAAPAHRPALAGAWREAASGSLYRAHAPPGDPP